MKKVYLESCLRFQLFEERKNWFGCWLMNTSCETSSGIFWVTLLLLKLFALSVTQKMPAEVSYEVFISLPRPISCLLNFPKFGEFHQFFMLQAVCWSYRHITIPHYAMDCLRHSSGTTRIIRGLRSAWEQLSEVWCLSVCLMGFRQNIIPLKRALKWILKPTS